MDNPYDAPEISGGNQISIEYKRNNIFKGKKTGSATINAGGAIIIIIFVVLCLTIFGLLSFTTAFADKRLADRTLLSVQQYYEADTRAEQMLAAVYQICSQYDDISGDGPWLLEQIIEAVEIRGVELISVSLAEPFTPLALVTYQAKMNDMQALYAEIEMYYNESSELDYKILKWHIILISDLDYANQGQDVWDGGFDGFWFD